MRSGHAVALSWSRSGGPAGMRYLKLRDYAKSLAQSITMERRIWHDERGIQAQQ